MKRLIEVIAISIMILLQVSCGEDWLKPEPLSFYAPENVYVDEAGFESGLVSLRKSLKGELYGYWHFYMAEFAPTDLCVAGYIPDFARNTPSSSTRIPYLSMFNKVYGSIKDANVIIARIDDIDWGDEEVRNSILAQAYWYRSYWYYRMIHSYGDIPFVGEELKGAKLDFRTHSRWAILDEIQKDMEWAVEHLPESAPAGRVTKGAGNHLLAKIYLANTEFDKAIVASSKVIDGPYALMTERFGSYIDDPSRNVLWDLHRVENISLPENTEVILSIIDRMEAPIDARDYPHRSYMWQPHYFDARDETGSRAILYPPAGPVMDSLGRGGGAMVSSSFHSYDLWKDGAYTWKNTPDLRRSDVNWVEMSEIRYDNPDSPNFGEPIQKLWPTDADTTLRWCSWPRYILWNPNNGPENRWQGGNGDMYVFRLAETYLIRAEAYYWKGQLPQAANDINVIRERSNAPLITAAAVTIDYIFDERARELYTNEPRHTEMVRVSNIMAKLNIGGYNLEQISEKSWWYDRVMRLNTLYDMPLGSWWAGHSVTMEPHNIYWAIPQSVIVANTLGKINQNIGYPGAENNEPPLDTIEPIE